MNLCLTVNLEAVNWKNLFHSNVPSEYTDISDASTVYAVGKIIHLHKEEEKKITTQKIFFVFYPDRKMNQHVRFNMKLPIFTSILIQNRYQKKPINHFSSL